MTTQRFKMHLEVPSKLVGTIIELLDGEGILVSVEPVVDKPKKVTRYAGGKRNKGISAVGLIVECLTKSKVLNMSQLRAFFTDRGFSENSVHPSLSKLVQDKRVKNDSGKYSLVKP